MVPIVVVIHVPFMSWGTHDHQGRRRRIGLETSQEKEDDKSQCIKDPNAEVSLLQEGSWCGRDLGGVIQSWQVPIPRIATFTPVLTWVVFVQ